MSEISIISACPKCGGMPIVRQLFAFALFGEPVVYDVVCEDCRDNSCVAFSPEDAIKEWEAHCKQFKQKTRSREDACTTRTD